MLFPLMSQHRIYSLTFPLRTGDYYNKARKIKQLYKLVTVILVKNTSNSSKWQNGKNISIQGRLQCLFFIHSPKELQFILQVPAPMSPPLGSPPDTAKQHLVLPLCSPAPLPWLHNNIYHFLGVIYTSAASSLSLQDAKDCNFSLDSAVQQR